MATSLIVPPLGRYSEGDNIIDTKRRRRRAPAGTRTEKAAGRDSDWGEEIYAAPGEVRAAAERDEDARVTVATGLRRPRVYLTAPYTVPRLDLRRYMGRWYEIARLPYFTQRRCVGDVYAEYRLGKDGMIYVTNRCRHQDGGIGEAKGLARVADARSNARLQISFRMLYGVHVFWDDYWVIGLGDDYEYALVGQPTRRRGWVLAREPDPSEAQIKQWLQEFADKGFPAAGFVRTQQGKGSIPQLPPTA